MSAKFLPGLLLCLIVFGTVLLSPAKEEQGVKMKSVTLDDFFGGQLEPLPLKLMIPADYVHAKELEAEETYSYWMLSSEVKKVAASGDLPAKTGYIYGKISLDVGWIETTKKFSNEADYKKDYKEAGITIVEEKRRDAGGYPVWSIIASIGAKNGKPAQRLYTAYLATKMDTACLYFAYVPPAGLADAEATRIWTSIIESISKK